MSPVEQIALTVNIALRRDASTLDHYRAGSSPDAFATLPNEWTADQIRSFQDYFDALMSGNLARRRQTKFMARRLQADRGAPAASEGPVRRMAGAHHLLRLLGARFAIRQPSEPRDGETLRQQATQEGLVPLRLPSRADIHDLELRLGERMDSLAARFDRALDPHHS